MQSPEWLKKKAAYPRALLLTSNLEPSSVQRSSRSVCLQPGIRQPHPNRIGKWKSGEPKKKMHMGFGFGDFDTYLEQAIGKTEGEASKRFDTNAEAKRAWLK